MKLVVIESPSKREALKKYLGSGYEIFATKGHIRDLPQKGLAIDINNNFTPKYEIVPDKKELIDRLTALQLDGKKFEKFTPIIFKVLKFIKNADVMDVYKKLKRIGLAKDIDYILAVKYRNKKLLDIVDEIYLSLFDGSTVTYSRDDDYYKLIISVVSIPSKIFKKNNDMKKLIFAIDSILTGGNFNNQKDII